MNPPVIETIKQAIDISQALHHVVHTEVCWAENTFASPGAYWLNAALAKLWTGLTDEQRGEIFARYVAARLSR